jgi:hypothetical protein
LFISKAKLLPILDTRHEIPYARRSKKRVLINSTDDRPDVIHNTLPSWNDTPVRQAILDFVAEAGEVFRDI